MQAMATQGTHSRNTDPPRQPVKSNQTRRADITEFRGEQTRMLVLLSIWTRWTAYEVRCFDPSQVDGSSTIGDFCFMIIGSPARKSLGIASANSGLSELRTPIALPTSLIWIASNDSR